MTFDKLTLAIPAHWFTAIAYGDCSGMDDSETGSFERWLDDMTREFGPITIGSINTNSYFARYHDAAEYGVLACECCDVDFLFNPVICHAAV